MITIEPVSARRVHGQVRADADPGLLVPVIAGVAGTDPAGEGDAGAQVRQPGGLVGRGAARAGLGSPPGCRCPA
jgi:hypothetical protein